MRHTERYYRIAPFEWSDIQNGDIQDSEIRIEPVEAAYMARPTQELFDSMSLASFVERYELAKKVFFLLCSRMTMSGKGRIRMDTLRLARKRTSSVQHPGYHQTPLILIFALLRFFCTGLGEH
jgi:hypothetical protein